MRRTAVTIPTSIAKGQARYETRDFLQQLSYADGSLAELETQLLLSVELQLCVAAQVEELLKEVDELQRMLHAIARKLRSNSPLATHHSPLSSGEE
jgi:carbamoyl-phosphate synthase large subunit